MFGKEAGYWQDILRTSDERGVSDRLGFGGDGDGVPADFRSLLSELSWRTPKRNIRLFDAYIRGSDLGGVKERAERVVTMVAMGAVATAIDLVDYAAEALGLAGPAGGLVATVLEVGTDQLIALGANELVQEMTEDEEAEFISPLSHTVSTVSAGAPQLRHAVNSVNVEAGQQALFNIPVYGAIFEKQYIALNKAIEWLENDDRPWWVSGATRLFTGGLARGLGRVTNIAPAGA